MCSTIGSKPVVPLPLDRLRRLEYRGNGPGNAGRDPIGECNDCIVEMPTVNHSLAPVLHRRTQSPAYRARSSKASVSNSRASWRSQ
jgi:hypothetical protein